MPSQLPQYKLYTKLDGHAGAIIALKASGDGSLLASGAVDGTQVWDIAKKQALDVPPSPSIRGATTAIAWVKRTDDTKEALVFGTQTGFLVCWKGERQKTGLGFHEKISNQMQQPSEVTGIQFDSASNRLVVCNCLGVVQLFTVNKTIDFVGIFSVKIANFVPRAVDFGFFTGNERDILVFGLYGGTVHTLSGQTGDIIGEPWSVGAHIGDVAVDIKNGVVCMDDPSTGCKIFAINDKICTKAFPIPVTKNKRTRQVAFAHDSKFVVSGSDHGIVYLFDRGSGRISTDLKINGKDWVQTVGATENAGVSTIFAAKSRDGMDSNVIYVWREGKEFRKCPGSLCAAFILLQVVLVALGAVLAWVVLAFV